MNEVEPEPLEENYVSLLAAGEQALAAGATLSIADSDELPSEIKVELKRDLACVDLLRQVLPRFRPDGSDPAVPATQECVAHSRLSETELPWTNLGRFQIRRELGQGNFGIVYLAYDPRLNREVALKVPRVNALADPQLRERFQREARSAAALDHPNLVPVYEAGEVGPVCYIASAYCPGITLAKWLKERDGPVPFRTAATLVAQVADGVDHAHRQGIVHRDLKPGNILLVSAGVVSGEWSGDSPPLTTHHSPLTPKITDFGLAKFFLGEEDASQTRSGALVGTPSYMAPEQAEGRRKGVGPAADVYALGVILYEVLTGRPPFQADSVLETLLLVRKEEPMPPRRLLPKLPRDLETICLKCLEKEPHKRYASAGDLAADLRRFLASKPIQARPVGAWERVLKWARRRPAAAALVAVSSLGSLVLVIGLGVGLVLIADALREKGAALTESEQTSYFNGIGSAEREISARNWGRAEELLRQCPEKLRAWEWHYLNRLRHIDPISLRVGKPISMAEGFDLAFHPDGRLLAIPSSDNNSIEVWDASTGREMLTPLRGHGSRVLAVAFSPDGRLLASGSQDNTVKVWDATSGQELFTCHHSGPVKGVVFSPNGHLLASASDDRTVKVWDATSGKLLFGPFPGQAVLNVVVHIEFSPDGRWLAAGSEGNTVKLWDLTTGQEVILSGHTDWVINVTFTPDGRRLISAGRDRRVNVWNLEEAERGVLAPRWTWTDGTNSVWCMALSPDGSLLAIGGPTADGNVRVYDMTTGELLRTLMGDYRIVSVAFSPDGRRLASAGYDRIVRLWDTTTGREVLPLRDWHADIVGCVRFSPDGQRLASASADGTVRVFDASPFGEDADRRIRTLREPDGEFFCVAFSPTDSRLLASASTDKSIKLWNVQTGQVVRTFEGHQEAVVCVDFSPDGLHLLSGSMDRTVKLWDVQTGEELPLPGCEGFKVMVRSVAFQPPDGQAIATGSLQMVHLWDIRGRRPPLQKKANQELVMCVAFSRDGKYLAAVGPPAIAKVWNVTNLTSGEEVCSFTGHKKSVFCVAFHPKGKYLASGDSDKKVKLWAPESPSGREIDTLSGHTDYVEGVAFSPDGAYLATASWREVIVWNVTDLENIKQVRTFDRLAGRIWSVAFSKDGKRLAAASGYKGKGEITIWDASLWEQSVVPSP